MTKGRPLEGIDFRHRVVHTEFVPRQHRTEDL